MAVVANEAVAQYLVYALIKEDAYLMAGEQGLFRFLDSLHGHLPPNSGKTLQKAFQAMSRLDIVE